MTKSCRFASLRSFQNDAKAFVERLHDTKEPLVLTVDGKPTVVVQDAEAYQVMLEELERARFMEAVREGLREADQERGRPVDEIFAAMKAKQSP